MKRRALVVMAVVVLALAVAVPASAITYGVPDDYEHPYVVMLGFFSSDTEFNADTWMWRCSGTLVSPTVVLTAGHCTYGPEHALVWFEESHQIGGPTGYPYSSMYDGEPYPHPNYNDFAEFPNTYDAGVVVLSTPVTGKGYGTLPTPGYLDNLAIRRGLKETTFMVVGFGVNSYKPELVSLRTRYKATSSLINLGSALNDGYNLQTTNNPGQGNERGDISGGTCSGDSGGPVFYPVDSNRVVGINSFGLNANCKGNDFSYRTDISYTLDFLATFGVYPTP